MRRVQVQNLKPGMILARTIFNSNGNVLLSPGIILSDDIIRELSQIGLASIYIKDKFYNDFTGFDYWPDVVSDNSRNEAIKTIKSNFNALQDKQIINIGEIKSIVENILDELLAENHTLIHLFSIRTFDDYTFAHSVNVCILAIISALTLGFERPRLKELGIGALLHDIGKTQISAHIINKPDDLTTEEYHEVQRHSQYGFDILREYPEISLLSAHVALQHHERWDGKGYPRQLAGENIHIYARITSVADVYDALLADRHYRHSYNSSQALTIIRRMSGLNFDPLCVNALLSNVARYSLGSMVELTTGEIGVVVEVSHSHPTRPILKIAFDRHLRRVPKPHVIDLSKFNTIMIKRNLAEREIAELYKR